MSCERVVMAGFLVVGVLVACFSLNVQRFAARRDSVLIPMPVGDALAISDVAPQCPCGVEVTGRMGVWGPVEASRHPRSGYATLQSEQGSPTHNQRVRSFQQERVRTRGFAATVRLLVKAPGQT